MHVILVEFQQVLILKYPDALVDQLLGPHSVVVKLQLEGAFVVGEVDLETSGF